MDELTRATTDGAGLIWPRRRGAFALAGTGHRGPGASARGRRPEAARRDEAWGGPGGCARGRRDGAHPRGFFSQAHGTEPVQPMAPLSPLHGNRAPSPSRGMTKTAPACARGYENPHASAPCPKGGPSLALPNLARGGLERKNDGFDAFRSPPVLVFLFLLFFLFSVSPFTRDCFPSFFSLLVLP